MDLLAGGIYIFLKNLKPSKEEAEAAWMVACQEYFEMPKEVNQCLTDSRPC